MIEPLRTVGDLIDALAALPRDMLLMVNGYEGGYDHPRRIAQTRLHQEYDTREDATCFGRFWDWGSADNPEVVVVVLER